jgi:hypothetical protein
MGEESEFNSRQIFSSLHSIETASGAHQTRMQKVTGAVSPEIKLQGSDAYHVPPSIAEVKNA